MATNSTIPIWATTIAPDAEGDAVDNPRDDAYGGGNIDGGVTCTAVQGFESLFECERRERRAARAGYCTVFPHHAPHIPH